MKKESFKIDGMSCHHCVMAVNKALSQINLNSVNVNVGSAEVEYDESKVSHEQIVAAIEEAGYSVA